MFSIDTPRGPLRLVELHQGLTYGGSMEGYPNERLNRSILDDMPRRVTEALRTDLPVHVIPPRLTPRDPPSKRRGRLGPQVDLPPIWCAGVWATRMNADLDWWEVAVGWFQDGPGGVVDADLLDAFRALDLPRIGERCWF